MFRPLLSKVCQSSLQRQAKTPAVLLSSSRLLPPVASNMQCVSFHFATHEYSKTFLDLPKPDTESLRNSAKSYLATFNKQSWFDDPITSILNGEKLPADNTTLVETKDAFGVVNGKQHLASPEQVGRLKDHISTYKSSARDLRPQLRNIEQKLLTEHAGFLIGNQCLDFGKQDGITEMEESIMANAVERRLNDLLLQDEEAGKITVNRKPIYVSCVSNFTNFLDLFRKTVRCLEVGIPCVVLGRSNTVQHSYRWTALLMHLLKEEGVDEGMLSYLSCTLDDIKAITQSCKGSTGNLYTTCSRQLANEIMSGYPNTVASTGGPNTLVTTEWNDKVKDAVQMSASIESSGQCTALRHCVAPTSTEASQLEETFDDIKEIPSAPYAVDNALFDGIYANHQGSVAPNVAKDGYTRHSKVDAFYRIGTEPPAPNEELPEYWRKVVVDFSKMDLTTGEDAEKQINKLAAWLNTHQPISLAINGKRKEVFKLGVKLFDRTGMVVYTIGSTDNDQQPPALTCQARPQEAEVFGEFPPRSSLGKYTKYPVVVPSPTPGYDSSYTKAYLQKQTVDEYFGKSTRGLLNEVKDRSVQGYCIELIHYLQNATMTNPKMGHGSSRTGIWGLQRPPLGTKTWIRCDGTASWDDVAPVFLLFYTTNARDQAEISIDPSNTSIISLCEKYNLTFSMDTDDSFAKRSAKFQAADVFNVVYVSAEPLKEFSMAGQFVSLYMPLGHIKSTMLGDDEFVTNFKQLSQKWLTSLF